MAKSEESLIALLGDYRADRIAQECGVSYETARNWRRGRFCPKPEHYPALARFLRRTVNQVAQAAINDQQAKKACAL